MSLILLALSGALTAMTLGQIRAKRLRYPILYFFNILFLLLFILVPLIVESLGGAQTVRWHQSHLINQPYVISIYALYVLVFSATCLLLVSSARTKPVAPAGLSDAPYPEAFHRQYSFVLVLVVAFGLMVYVAGTGMSIRQLLVASRFSWLDNPGGDGLLVLLGLYIISIVAPAAFHMFSSNRTSILKVASLLALVGIMIAISGGRKWVLFIISGYIAAKYFYKGSFRFSPRDAFIVSGAFVFVFIWQAGRALADVSLNNVLGIFVDSSFRLFMEGDVSYFYRASLEAISININEGVWHPFSVIRRLVFLPFPNELTFGLKPEGLPAGFARDIGAMNSLRLGNMPPSMIGVFALSFGAVPGIPLFGIFLPVLLLKLDSFFMKRSILRDSLMSYAIVVMVTFARGNIDVLYYPFFYFLVFELVSVVLLLLRGSRQKRPAWRNNAQT